MQDPRQEVMEFARAKALSDLLLFAGMTTGLVICAQGTAARVFESMTQLTPPLSQAVTMDRIATTRQAISGLLGNLPAHEALVVCIQAASECCMKLRSETQSKADA